MATISQGECMYRFGIDTSPVGTPPAGQVDGVRIGGRAQRRGLNRIRDVVRLGGLGEHLEHTRMGRRAPRENRAAPQGVLAHFGLLHARHIGRVRDVDHQRHIRRQAEGAGPRAPARIADLLLRGRHGHGAGGAVPAHPADAAPRARRRRPRGCRSPGSPPCLPPAAPSPHRSRRGRPRAPPSPSARPAKTLRHRSTASSPSRPGRAPSPPSGGSPCVRSRPAHRRWRPALERAAPPAPVRPTRRSRRSKAGRTCPCG